MDSGRTKNQNVRPREEPMHAAFRNIERAREEVRQIHAELLQLENKFDSVRESLRKAMTELFGRDREAFPALQEAALVARMAEAVAAGLPVRRRRRASAGNT